MGIGSTTQNIWYGFLLIPVGLVLSEYGCGVVRVVWALSYDQKELRTDMLILEPPPPWFLALSVGQRLCINFSVSRANFLTTLRSHLDVTCSCYFCLNKC